MTPFLGELIGTTLLIILGCGVVANVLLNKTKGNNSGWIVIAFGWAMAVYVGVFVATPYSGAHLNPAVTIGLAVAGKFEWALVGPYIVAQILGAMIGAFIIWVTYRQHFNETDNADAKLAVFSTGPAIRNPIDNLFSEIIGTFVLVFAVLYIAGPSINLNNNDGKIGLGAIGALPVAFLVLAIGLSLGGTTGYAINPARDIGPRIMHFILPISKKKDSDWNYSWVPIIGPIIGGVIAAVLFKVV
ncbi:MAG: aquaporin family protein [Bacteroidetes bacterium]|nr:aquaporin family protein [Bacteroidota bacterium]MBS1973015.1 aquaporin family protein [Bacteroidota bacterium]